MVFSETRWETGRRGSVLSAEFANSKGSVAGPERRDTFWGGGVGVGRLEQKITMIIERETEEAGNHRRVSVCEGLVTFVASGECSMCV